MKLVKRKNIFYFLMSGNNGIKNKNALAVPKRHTNAFAILKIEMTTLVSKDNKRQNVRLDYNSSSDGSLNLY